MPLLLVAMPLLLVAMPLLLVAMPVLLVLELCAATCQALAFPVVKEATCPSDGGESESNTNRPR